MAEGKASALARYPAACGLENFKQFSRLLFYLELWKQNTVEDTIHSTNIG